MANELHPTTMDEGLYTDEYLSFTMNTTADKMTHHTHLDAHRGADQGVPVATMFLPPTVQTKLTINTPGDPFEQEADAMANRVTGGSANSQMKEGKSLRLQEEEEETILPTKEEEKETIQRAEGEEETIQRLEDKEEAPIQRMEDKEEETVQRKEEEKKKGCETCAQKADEMVQRSANSPTSHAGTVAPSIVSEVVSSPGQNMDKGTQSKMENSFGTDFSSVRIHNDDKAQNSAKSISAQAYTYGSHIVFGRGKYEPQTRSGKHLLAHELTHVVQQGAAIRRRVDPNAGSIGTSNTSKANSPSIEPPIAITLEAATETIPTNSASSEVAVENVPPAEGPPLPTIVELVPIMPEPPDSLSQEVQGRLNSAQNRAGTAASNNADLPAANELSDEARGGVTEPTTETDGRASGQLTATLNQRVAPSPEIEELCENIRRVIREKRPPDEDSLLQADPEEAANVAGNQLNQNIDSDVDRVEGEYDDLDESPTGTPEQIGEAVELPPEEVGEPNINAQGAAPDPLSEEEVSLEADVEASAQQMEEAGMVTPVTEVIPDGPIAEARAVHGELEESAAEDPALVLLEQEEALGNARTDMAALQERALRALESARAGTVRDSGDQQTGMVDSETNQRDAMGIRAEEIFTSAQERVNDLLTPLTETAMTMWEAGKTQIATEFEQHLARVQSWVDERHSGFGGGLVELWDDLTGLPGWVTDEYDDAEETFGDDVCALIGEISIYVNGIVATCEEIINLANNEINTLFDNAPKELREWAEAEKLRFQGRLDGLREEVSNTQENFNQDLANRASEAVQEVRERVHALREAAKGLLGKIADAITEFLEDPIRAIINGLLRLVGIEPAAFWALVARIEQVISDIADDPLGFASNLLAAVGAGFQNFFDNFFGHLFEGFISWIFSGLGAVGVEIPPDFSLKSIITFFLQLMGITWERIRMLLARHIGEENVALLEQAYEIISELIELGPQGVFELIKDKLDPRQILDQVIKMAVNFVIETLVTQATIRIVALFNPVGAIVQAIEAIYKVMKWIFENAARIFTLVETVVNGIADIIAGNIAGMATAVESALKQLLVPVIDFVASFMGLGDLPEKVADMVRGLQNWVEGILDTVIGFLATQARNLLSALGISEDADPVAEDGDLQDSEVGDDVSFRGGDEQHKIWVTISGSNEELMVASDTPMPISQRLRDWENRISELPAEQRSSTGGLINSVRQQYNIVLDESEQASDAIEEAQQNPIAENIAAAEAEDGQVEAAERGMTPELGQLFDLFEGGVRFNPIDQNIAVGSTSFSVKIVENDEGFLEAQLENNEVNHQFVALSTGAFGMARHPHGLAMVRQAMATVTPIIDLLQTLRVRDGKIASTAAQGLEGYLNDIAAAIETFGDSQPQSWSHLLIHPPTQNITPQDVTFAQSMGDSQTIIQEYDRQLGLQQDGMNILSVDQWIFNRNAYSLDEDLFLRLDTEQRRVVLNELKERAEQAQNTARSKKQRYENAISDIEEAFQPANLENPNYSPDFNDISLVTGRFGNESSWRRKRGTEINTILADLRQDLEDWKLVFQKAAVLHNADQIAGGFGEIPDISIIEKPDDADTDEDWRAYISNLEQYVGSSNVNSSIGSLWRTNIEGLDSAVRSSYLPQAWPIWKMNVTLRRV